MQYPNTFQAQTPIGAAIAGLGNALLSGPTPYQREYMQSGTDYRNAEAQHMLAQDAAVRAKAAAASGIGGLINKYHASLAPGGDPYGALADVATNLAQQGETSNLPGLWRALVANQGGSDDQIVHAMAGAGNALGVNDAVSLPGQAAVFDRNQAGAVDLKNIEEAGSNTRQGMSDATSRANNSDTIAGALARMVAEHQQFPTDAEIKGGSLKAAIPTMTPDQLNVLHGVQSPFSGQLVKDNADHTLVLDKSSPTAIATPVPSIGVGPRGERALVPTNLDSTIGSSGSDPETAARRTKESMAQSLGISTQELDFVTAYESMMKSGGLLGQVNPPKESKARYDAIQRKIAGVQMSLAPAHPSVPAGLTPVP